MKERPILFSAPMVRALLDGTKTQTRRLVKSQPGPEWAPVVGPYHPTVIDKGGDQAPGPQIFGASDEQEGRKCPYGQPGDLLWVRETWADLGQLSDGNFERQAIYRADDIERYGDEDEYVDVTAPDMRWRSSIHMPRWASRIQLEVVSVSVERLQAISTGDCHAEGIGQCDGLGSNAEILDLARRVRPFTDAALRYATLWEQINGAGSWDANPWVWVVEFKRPGT